ncbi:alcohol dehydrogenase catalytic domain-containing protein [Streptomyces sp. SCUT-3]|uniref:alcohol dehydrogenase catalytic domain-containing protein n=2 Tax=Streptomyces TaxID=1883 RepID=UPI000CC8206E|nr:alcohol dehydrogenase catalytic domain-containing protein [Streptomyces sp. SCUT-3]PLW74115.1 IMP dehydrogenase [Streptomyces sp. DJ]QMV22186.1 alcohol dehydrogenase catalytic domain-containing protein [Streptomyces sp. SCUT-3]
MRATVLEGVGQVRLVDVPDPVIEQPSDALVRVSLAAVCGSDLWPFRGQESFTPGDRMGHEWIGVVEEVGADVTRLRAGDLVLAPFAFADGTCRPCRDGLFTSCPNGGFWGGRHDGGQAEAVRVPFADGTLVPVRAEADAELLRRLLPLTDVMATGAHAVFLAGVRPGSTVVVLGDGAVGLCAVLAARRARAGRIILVGRHPDRSDLAKHMGATDVLAADDLATVGFVRDETEGGVSGVVECAGTQSALDLAIDLVRPGGTIGSVGVPNGVDRVDLYRLFRHNIALRAGVTPARRYLEPLLAEVLAGRLDPSPVLSTDLPLDAVATAYQAMNTRRAIKIAIRP